jgi:hypothetical protein
MAATNSVQLMFDQETETECGASTLGNYRHTEEDWQRSPSSGSGPAGMQCWSSSRRWRFATGSMLDGFGRTCCFHLPPEFVNHLPGYMESQARGQTDQVTQRNVVCGLLNDAVSISASRASDDKPERTWNKRPWPT